MSITETATATNKLEQQQQQQHDHRQDDASDMEKKLKSKVETSKNFIIKCYHQAQFYWDAIKVNLINLWQL